MITIAQRNDIKCTGIDVKDTVLYCAILCYTDWYQTYSTNKALSAFISDMIGTSIYDYIFIRSCILVLHWIAPFSILYCLSSLIYPASFHVSWVLQAWTTLETAFYLLVYYPRKIYLQRAASHPKPICRDRRRLLFQRCQESIPDPERYLMKWFMDAPASEIKWENVKDFFRWAFLNTGVPNTEDDEELEEFVSEMEKLLGRKIDPGRGNAECFRLTLGKVDMLHRSLIWYMVSLQKNCAITRHLIISERPYC